MAKTPENRTEISIARKKAGLTQAQLSKMFDIPLSTVIGWEQPNRGKKEYVINLVIEKLNKMALENKQEQTKIALARINAGLTQVQMSEMFDIPLLTIQSWERKLCKPAKYLENLLIEKLSDIANKK